MPTKPGSASRFVSEMYPDFYILQFVDQFLGRVLSLAIHLESPRHTVETLQLNHAIRHEPLVFEQLRQVIEELLCQQVVVFRCLG
jgi:hypothetical protein